MRLWFDKKQIKNTGRKLQLPLFLQIQFRADWLCHRPFSSTKRIVKMPEDQDCLKKWKPTQLPVLYSPVNSLTILKSQRILCLVKLSEGDSKTAENFAYFVIDFAHIKTTVKGEHILMFNGPLIGYNSKLGTFEGVLRFSIDQTEIE